MFRRPFKRGVNSTEPRFLRGNYGTSIDVAAVVVQSKKKSAESISNPPNVKSQLTFSSLLFRCRRDPDALRT